MSLICPRCQAVNYDTANDCRRCKAPLPKLCPSCGFQAVRAAIFCSRCGHLFQDQIEKTFGAPDEQGTPQPRQRYDPKKFAPRKRTLASCPDCGRQVSNEAKFCPGCGHIFPEEHIEPPAEPTKPKAPPTQKPQPKPEAKPQPKAAAPAQPQADIPKPALPKAAPVKPPVPKDPPAKPPEPRTATPEPKPTPRPIPRPAPRPAPQPLEKPAAAPEPVRPVVPILKPQPPPASVQVPQGMVYVAGGELRRKSNGKVAQIKPFLIDLEPVTCEQYRRFVLETNRRHPEDWIEPQRFLTGKERCPVVWVTLDDALAYAVWAGKRLPSELEWELAAGGLQGATYPWGNQFKPEHCNTIESGHRAPTPVDAYPQGRSSYGCLDMVGNVSEWIQPGATNGNGPFVFKGGCYIFTADLATVQARMLIESSAYKTFCIGFRCVKDV